MEVSRARSILYDLFALFFLPDFNEEKYTLALKIIQNLPQTGVESFDKASKALKEALCRQKPSEIREEFEKFFIVPFEGEQIPLEASYYLDGKIFGPSLVKLRQLLERLGLAKVEEIPEPEDHLGVLLALMAESARQKSLIEQRELFYNFLRPCVYGVSKRLGKKNSFYKTVVKMLEAFLELEARFFEEA